MLGRGFDSLDLDPAALPRTVIEVRDPGYGLVIIIIIISLPSHVAEAWQHCHPATLRGPSGSADKQSFGGCGGGRV